MGLASASVLQIRDQVNRREVRAEEVARGSAEQIAALDGRIGSFLTCAAEQALDEAREVDRRVDRGETLPLAGVPMAIKDVLCTRGIATTCGSRILETFRPPYDATAVARLRHAGALVMGKANLDEFAMGSSSENSAFGPVRNPWALDRVPGGSSGGSAAAVAAGMVAGSLGTDTGGSVRQPASLCGVVGLKPTYGRVSRFGLIAFASSLDHVGPMARSVGDCAALLGAMAGPDPCDMTSAEHPIPDYEAALGGGVRGLRVGVPVEYFGDGLSEGVEAAVRGALERLRDLGAEIEEISLPHTAHAVPAYYIVANAEASSNLARFDGVRYGLRGSSEDGLERMYRSTRSAGFGPEAKRRIMIGTFALSSGYYDAYYVKALKVRRLIRRDFEAAFREVDVIACPTAPETAFPLGAKLNDPLSMYLSDVFTVTANLAGVPAISIPCGLDADGLPVGFQMIGRHFDEAGLLRAAQALEDALDLHLRPPVFAGEP